MQDHLRSVPTTDEGSEKPPANERTPQRPRAKEPLPTDRMKFDVQVETLRAFVIGSNNGRDAVGAADIAKLIEVSSPTAGLNNSFFEASGWLNREAKGLYKPTATACEFSRQYGLDKEQAGRVLAGTVTETWYMRVTRQRLSMGAVSRAQLVRALIDGGGAYQHHEGHVGNLIDWMDYMGLIEIKDDHVTLADESPSGEAEAPPEDADAKVESPATLPADAQGKGATTPRATDQVAAPILSFDFGFQLTSDDLAKFSPEQIRALFEAVGTVVAVRAEAQQ